MRLRFRGRLAIADGVSLANASIGFVAVIVALVLADIQLTARLLLLAAVADGLDGVLARRYGSSQVGEMLDSLSDVVSFGVAPAALVFAIGQGAPAIPAPQILAASVALVFLTAGVVRLCLYTVEEAGSLETIGVPTTLAATVLAASVLAGLGAPTLLLASGLLFAGLMLTDLAYPDLRDRDALTLGAVQVLAILAPTVAGRALPRLLLVAALAYLVFGPRYYWGPTSQS